MNATARGLEPDPAALDEVPPLSSSQEQMWLLDQVSPSGQAYLMTWTFRLTGRLDVEALRRAFTKLVERHAILRTRYRLAGAKPEQVIDAPGPVAFRLISLDEEPADNRARRARQIAAWERTRPFDLAEHWPIRVSVIGEDQDSHLLIVNIHHIACDDVAFRILVAEIEQLYAAELAGSPAEPDPPRRQYAQYASAESRRLRSGELDRHLEYWCKALSGTHELTLPFRPQPEGAVREGGVIELEISQETSAAVHDLAAAQRSSPFMVLLAAYHVWLSRLSGSDDVTVGFPVSYRTPDLDDLLGNLVNTAVSRTRHRPGECFADVLKQVRGCILDAMDHRFAPFARVVEALDPARANSSNPLFQVAFDMERAGEGSVLELAGLRAERLGAPVAPEAKFALTLHAAEDGDGRLYARLEYAGSSLDAETARSWAEQAARTLAALVADPHVPIPFEASGSSAAESPGGGPEPENQAADELRAASASLMESVRLVWADVLEDSRIGVHDNFFDVGGDSLRAVAVAGRLRVAGHDVAAADVFSHQSVAELASLCARRREAASAAGTPGRPAVRPFELVSPADRSAVPDDAVDAYPLAAMQLGMIIELRNRPGIRAYQDSTSYLIRDDTVLDVRALQEAAQQVVDRHEVLRTSFDLNSYSVPLQVVHRGALITVGLTEHGALGEQGWHPRMVAHAAYERSVPIDMARPPLIRVHAHTAADTADWCITLTEFHPILEGWSFHTMLMEILDGYRTLRSGRALPAPEPIAFRYADYVAAEALARESDSDREFWRAAIDGRDVVAVPVAWQADSTEPRDRYQHLVHYGDLEADLRRLAAVTRTSLKAVLLAAHMKVMSMLAGTERFFSGLVCDARPEVAGAERVLGMYLNTLPFAMPVGARTWGDLVKAVYDELTDLWPHRVYPMQLIQQEHGRGGRLFEVFFNYLDFHQVDRELVDEQATYNDNENEFALHVFTFIGILKFNTTNHRLSRSAALRLGALYRGVFEEMALGPEGAADRSSLPGPERAALLALDRGAEPLAAPSMLADSLDRIARDAPDRLALRCGAEELTYAGLVDALDKGPSPRLQPDRDRCVQAVVTALRELRDDDGASERCAKAVARVRTELESRAGLDAESTWLCSAPLTSTRGLIELLTPLTVGGSVIVTTDALPDCIPEIRGLIAAGEVTHMFSTSLVADRIITPDSEPKVTVIEPLYIDGEFGPVALDGLPLPGLSLQVLDEHGRPLPRGVVGELVVSGSDGTGPRRTGLAARVDVDGRLRLAGSPRVHRTEELLAAESGVREARVHEGCGGAGSDGRIVGFVLPEAGRALDPDEVNRTLAERRLPRAFVPDEVVVVEEWPLTELGEVDFARLREDYGRVSAGAESAAAPWDGRFEAILRAVLDSPDTHSIEPDRSLSDIGMNSMATVSAIVAIENAYGIVIPDDFQIIDMLRTPRKLWEQICQLRESQGVDEVRLEGEEIASVSRPAD